MNIRNRRRKLPIVIKSVHISAAAKKLISEYGLDSSEITGTGANGNITKKDVEKHIKQLEASPEE